MTINQRIKDIMYNKRLSQQDLADVLNVTDSYISQKLNGREIRSLKFIEPVAKFLGVTVQYLLYGHEGIQAKEPEPVYVSSIHDLIIKIEILNNHIERLDKELILIKRIIESKNG